MVSSVRFSIASSSPRSSLERDLLGAAITGQLAGLFMLTAMVVSFTLFVGTAWYHPVQVIGAFALGDEALPGSFSLMAFCTGLVIHQLVASFAWSLAFGALINKAQRSFSNVLALGLAIGVASQLAGAALIAPIVMSHLHGHNIWAEQVPQASSWVAHLVFGASFLLYIPVRQVLRRRAYSLGV